MVWFLTNFGETVHSFSKSNFYRTNIFTATVLLRSAKFSLLFSYLGNLVFRKKGSQNSMKIIIRISYEFEVEPQRFEKYR